MVAFTNGRDVQVVITASNGQTFDLSGITSFDAKPQFKTMRHDGLNTAPDEEFVPDGHRITFSLERTGPANEAFFVALENGYWNVGSGGAPGFGGTGVITRFITERGGGQTISQWTGVSLKMTDEGTFRQDAYIKQSFEAFASQKVA